MNSPQNDHFRKVNNQQLTLYVKKLKRAKLLKGIILTPEIFRNIDLKRFINK